MKRVYFIKPIGMDGPIKIGCSQSPTTRRKTLETWSPFALEIIAEIDGDFDTEKRFHALFESTHQRREWFNPSSEMALVIKQINDGEFDISTLPLPKNICTRSHGLPKQYADQVRLQMSYAQRVWRAEHKSGFMCPVQTYNMIEQGDAERIALVDAFLAWPHLHGKPINAKWAEEKRQAA